MNDTEITFLVPQNLEGEEHNYFLLYQVNANNLFQMKNGSRHAVVIAL